MLPHGSLFFVNLGVTMEQPTRFITRSIECQTMGHERCRKTLTIENGKCVGIDIEHSVYGRRIFEKVF